MNNRAKLRILQIDEGSNRSDILAQSVFETGNDVIVRIRVNDDPKPYIEKYNPDVLFVDMTYPSEDIVAKIAFINEYMPRPIVFFAERSESNVIDTVVKAGVSAFVVDGFNSSRILPVIDVAISRFRQTQFLKTELLKTKESLAERKLIDKAKGILMKQRSMDEDMAYKTLRSLAMNQNKKIGLIAKEVIDVAGLLLN